MLKHSLALVEAGRMLSFQKRKEKNDKSIIAVAFLRERHITASHSGHAIASSTGTYGGPGGMASTNARVRGKIPHEEWPKIVERFQRGQTLAEIARSYGCTPPAIRYIVGRAGGPSVPAGHSARLNAREIEPSSAPTGRTSLPQSSGMRRAPVASAGGNDIWGRINNDIAGFLAAMDALFTSENDRNYESLLAATDRLLWASARTRLEVERVLAERRTQVPRRRVVA